MNQLRRTLGLADAAQVQDAMAGLAAMAETARLDDAGLARLLATIPALLEQVDASYEQHDRDTKLLQRSLDLTSEELLAANDRMQQEGEQRYRTLYDGIIDALFVCAITPEGKLGNFFEVNEVACARLGYTRQELLGMSPHDIDGSADTVDMDPLTAEILEGRSVIVEKVHVAKDGRRIPVEVHAHRFEMLGRSAAMALVRDITERVRSEEQLRLWPKVFEASREAILIADSEERVVSVNHAVTEITGYGPEEILGRTPRLFASGRHDAEFYREMWQAILSEGHWQGEIWDRRKSGEIYPKWLSISSVRNHENEVTHYIASFTDITERKANEERIRFLAYHDPLTGLPNRVLLRDRFAQEVAHARRGNSKVALLFLDLDRFKTVNDSLGHPMGDKLLHAVTVRLIGCVRESDTISRQGGDEFVIVLSDRNGVENLPLIVHKLLDRLSEPFEIDGHVLNASTSIGISIFPDDGEDFDTLLQKADTAMYQAKEGGRNTFRYFTEQMNQAALERMELEGRLRNAVERGELLLHYQPQIALTTGRIVGVEALLRWNSPELGTVGPNRFIPVAEESGLIVPIGEWVLGEACRQARAWHAAEWPGLTIAINLSAVQFRRGDLFGTVSCALADTGIDPGCVELELTESILIQEAESTLATVRRMKGLGVQLSIDDFGTGYSSLSYLKRFAVDRLKIDQSFVRGLPHNRDDAAIVRAVIQMAHSLELTVIAEGVETEDQADFLRTAGCDLAQGYLFGRPQANPL